MLTFHGGLLNHPIMFENKTPIVKQQKIEEKAYSEPLKREIRPIPPQNKNTDIQQKFDKSMQLLDTGHKERKKESQRIQKQLMDDLKNGKKIKHGDPRYKGNFTSKREEIEKVFNNK